MTQARLTDSHIDDQGATFQFDDASREELADEIKKFFAKRGYRLEGGEPLDGMWGTGSPVMRALLGGFVKRFKFKVVATGTGDHLTLSLTKGMSGALGGVMGYMKMKKEVAELAAAMKLHFTF
jgi:hypothetical protein